MRGSKLVLSRWSVLWIAGVAMAGCDPGTPLSAGDAMSRSAAEDVMRMIGEAAYVALAGELPMLRPSMAGGGYEGWIGLSPILSNGVHPCRGTGTISYEMSGNIISDPFTQMGEYRVRASLRPLECRVSSGAGETLITYSRVIHVDGQNALLPPGSAGAVDHLFDIVGEIEWESSGKSGRCEVRSGMGYRNGSLEMSNRFCGHQFLLDISSATLGY